MPIQGDIAVIDLGGGHFAIIDAEDYPAITAYKWKARKSAGCWYAVRSIVKLGHEYTIRMHRQIALTPKGMQCHHKNWVTLDNRKANLQNLNRDDHLYAHGKTRCSNRRH